RACDEHASRYGASTADRSPAARGACLSRSRRQVQNGVSGKLGVDERTVRDPVGRRTRRHFRLGILGTHRPLGRAGKTTKHDCDAAGGTARASETNLPSPSRFAATKGNTQSPTADHFANAGGNQAPPENQIARCSPRHSFAEESTGAGGGTSGYRATAFEAAAREHARH